MANHGQPPQDTSATNRRGGEQAIVEMCEVTDSSLTFWSRHRFQIGSELQMRVSTAELPTALVAGTGAQPWVTLKGFVVQCTHVRRADGVQGFRVTLLLESALVAAAASTKIRIRAPWHPCLSAGRRFGLN